MKNTDNSKIQNTTKITAKLDALIEISLKKGIKLFDSQKYELAINYLSDTIKMGLYSAKAYFYRGSAYLALGKYKSAI